MNKYTTTGLEFFTCHPTTTVKSPLPTHASHTALLSMLVLHWMLLCLTKPNWSLSSHRIKCFKELTNSFQDWKKYKLFNKGTNSLNHSKSVTEVQWIAFPSPQLLTHWVKGWGNVEDKTEYRLAVWGCWPDSHTLSAVLWAHILLMLVFFLPNHQPPGFGCNSGYLP